MGRSDAPPIRSLPRMFIPGIDAGVDRFELPAEEYKKLTKVLRLSSGAQLAVMPGDGRLLRCELDGKDARVLETLYPNTESARSVTLCQALPRAEKLEEVVRMGSEIGVRAFVVFPSDRSVVKWDAAKLQDKLKRLESIAREAAEVAFRTHLPEFTVANSLKAVLDSFPDSQVLSEVEGVGGRLAPQAETTLVIGPEGGWSPREVELIGDSAVTLGPRVLRVDTAAAAACALALLA